MKSKSASMRLPSDMCLSLDVVAESHITWGSKGKFSCSGIGSFTNLAKPCYCSVIWHAFQVDAFQMKQIAPSATGVVSFSVVFAYCLHKQTESSFRASALAVNFLSSWLPKLWIGSTVWHFVFQQLIVGSVVVVPDRKMVSTPSFPHAGWGALYPSLQQLYEHRKSGEACNQGRSSFIINPHLTALKFTCTSFICIVMSFIASCSCLFMMFGMMLCSGRC